VQQHIPGTSVSNEYIAGFFDGEGSIGISPPRRTSLYLLHVQISQVDPTVLWLIKERFGGKIIRQRRDDHQRDIHRWSAEARIAERFILAIHPYLVVKRAQADIALSFRTLFTGANIIPRGNARRADHQVKRESILAARADCYRRLRLLNLRGLEAAARDKEIQ
jgi:hypothetical protein